MSSLPQDFINAKNYLLSRFNTIYTDETVKCCLILLDWFDYQDSLIKDSVSKENYISKEKIKEKIEYYKSYEGLEIYEHYNYGEIIQVLTELLRGEIDR